MGFTGRRIAEGSAWLSAGQLTSTAIAFVGSIVIARLLTPSEYGLIGVALAFPMLVLGLLDFRISEAIVRFTPLDKGKRYISTAFLFKIVSAITTSLLVFTLSDYVAIALNRPYVASMIRILSIYVLCEIIASAAVKILIGAGEYHKAILLSLVRNSVRITTSILLITLGLGVYGSIWGFSVASASALVISLILVSKYLRDVKFNVKLLGEIVKFSLPLYMPVVLGLPLNQVISIFLARHATNVELGNYSIASNLLIPLNITGGAMATSIYSTLPLLLGKEDKLREVIYKSTIYTSIVVLPIAMGLIVFSKPLVYIIYGPQYSLAPAYLSLLALTGLTAVLGSYVIEPYLKSVGETTKVMKISLVNYLVYVSLVLLLIPAYKVIGLIVASVIAGFFSTLYGLYIIRKDFGLEIVSRRSIVILGALSLPAITTWLTNFLPLSSIIIKYILGAIVYLFALILILSITIQRHELLELVEMSRNAKLLSLIVPKILLTILVLSNYLSYVKNRFSANKHS
jgi:O-antigen/teichoic acid export membrane protein